jgi:hypothetical protein
MNRCVARELRRSAWRPSRICEHPAEPRIGQAREPRSGRSEAKWLDRAVDRRTISRRDGRRALGRAARQRLAQRSRRAGGREAGGATVEAAAVQDSEQVRAHDQERTLPAKPDCEAASRAGFPARAALCPACDNDDALCRRTAGTCKWGVSDPLRVGPGAKKGAAKWGSLTPRLPPTGASTAARTRTRAAKSAARDIARSATSIDTCNCTAARELDSALMLIRPPV